MSVRIRFAPSPTGYLHIGGARTALFNWLYARHTGGTFVLRIEDTDTARNTQEAVDVILNGLRWLGLDWDEGPITGDPQGPGKGEYGPYFQSQRMDLYKRRVQELVDKGAAYAHEGAIKFRMERNPITIPDVVVGNVHRELTDRERLDPDFVIFRSDGQPVFHFVNVVDDLEMKITHVIRGEDHLTNTAKHLALFKAFGVEPPKYAHIPLILNPEGSKMSKRDTGASLTTYMDGGYAPEAVVNYLYLLGWSPKENRELVPIDEVIKMFDLPQILRHNARFDINKLHWLNGEYIKIMSQDRFNEFAARALERDGIKVEGFFKNYVNAAFSTVKEKVKQFTEVKTFADFYFLKEVEIEEASRKDLTADNRRIMTAVRTALTNQKDYSVAALNTVVKNVASELGVKIGLVVHPLRLACSGRTVGPSLYHLMEVLGSEQVLARIDRFIAQCPE
ncbi:MAG TPA: glutamate--tRNA ligase family protein [Candidatus Kapabacteria bacterium]|nr:glutamate--tRNA ligase family protein [Candidatus Kapabacteria bacterium]